MIADFGERGDETSRLPLKELSLRGFCGREKTFWICVCIYMGIHKEVGTWQKRVTLSIDAKIYRNIKNTMIRKVQSYLSNSRT